LSNQEIRFTTISEECLKQRKNKYTVYSIWMNETFAEWDSDLPRFRELLFQQKNFP